MLTPAGRRPKPGPPRHQWTRRGPRSRRPRLLAASVCLSFLFPPEVEAADAVDLEWDGVALGGRVVLRALLQRSCQRVGAHRLEKAGRRRAANVADLDRDGQRAGSRRAVDRACLRLTGK